ncbi:hypothetical protein DFH06DRAFT_1321544 [Mycena polygramma]|nr:hypothetical protein DFH06DRAFT_1321544 [Mycena polygramma]
MSELEYLRGRYLFESQPLPNDIVPDGHSHILKTQLILNPNPPSTRPTSTKAEDKRQPEVDPARHTPPPTPLRRLPSTPTSHSSSSPRTPSTPHSLRRLPPLPSPTRPTTRPIPAHVPTDIPPHEASPIRGHFSATSVDTDLSLSLGLPAQVSPEEPSNVNASIHGHLIPNRPVPPVLETDFAFGHCYVPSRARVDVLEDDIGHGVEATTKSSGLRKIGEKVMRRLTVARHSPKASPEKERRVAVFFGPGEQEQHSTLPSPLSARTDSSKGGSRWSSFADLLEASPDAQIPPKHRKISKRRPLAPMAMAKRRSVKRNSNVGRVYSATTASASARPPRRTSIGSYRTDSLRQGQGQDRKPERRSRVLHRTRTIQRE